MKFPFFNSGKNSDKKVVDIESSFESRGERKSKARAKFITEIFSKIFNIILAPFRWIKSLLTDISLKYVASIIAGVLFCIAVVGAVLIFVDPAAIEFEQKLKPKTDDDGSEKRVVILERSSHYEEIAGV